MALPAALEGATFAPALGNVPLGRGLLTDPGGAPYGSSGIIVNCPIVQRLL